jgi:hypothetical protein
LKKLSNFLLSAIFSFLAVAVSACGIAGTPPTEKTAPAITQQPANQSVAVGQNATFSVVASGSAPLSYQWYLGGAVAGTNASAFTVSQVTAAQNQSAVYVVVSNPYGSVNSASAQLAVAAAQTVPSITQQPVSQTVTAGQTATFSVSADGTSPLTYQWYLNNQPVGSNASSYSITGTTTAQTGGQVYVKITNAVGSATSTTVTLTVDAAATMPTITTQPTNQSVTAGQTATFTVAANGTTPLTYQWYFNGSASGSNSNSFAVAQTTTSESGEKVYVKITNSVGSATSNMVTLTVNAPAATPPSINTQPTNQTVTAGQTATFTVTVSGSAPLTYAWFFNGSAAGTNSNSFSVANTTVSQSGEKVYVKITNSAGSATSNTVTLTVNTAPTGSVNVLTFHNDNARTGQNLNETLLTPANVNFNTFGLIGTMPVDGLVDGQPLYVSQLNLSGGTHNVVYVVTENDSVYAFDADNFTQLWKVSVIGANETTSDARGCYQVQPQIGITSTPVIDLSQGSHGVIYLVAMTKDADGNYYQRLHALDITTGSEISGSPTTIQATFKRGSTTVTFTPGQYKERSALLLLNGVIYTTWASHCDYGPYQGWVIAYDEKTLQQSSVLNITPNGNDGAIWMAGDGPAADSAGNVYFLAANGTFDDTLDATGFPVNGDYGNAFLKLTTTATSTTVTDYFTMYNTDSESNMDQDLGSGGAILLPDLTDAQSNVWHLAVGAGKDQNIYVVNRDMLGKFNTNNDSGIYQEIDGGLGGGLFAAPAYFNNTVYLGGIEDDLRAFAITNAKLATTTTSQTLESFSYPGTSPSISANGTSNAILWAVENHGNFGVVHAYDPADLTTEYYNSLQAPNNRDIFNDNKYVTPMIANGRVYVGTPNGVAVLGLLSQ